MSDPRFEVIGLILPELDAKTEAELDLCEKQLRKMAGKRAERAGFIRNRISEWSEKLRGMDKKIPGRAATANLMRDLGKIEDRASPLIRDARRCGAALEELLVYRRMRREKVVS